MRTLRALALAMLVASAWSMWSCDNEAAPSANCPNPPHTWDANAQRCRAAPVTGNLPRVVVADDEEPVRLQRATQS
jgi:hypothetical protein